ncbi:hypothetical protein BDW22DRAFT_1360086 [Trametopsis cervina]|nr:hypothetical protein BDW22DRAFT_1360086 [Trametopsis cervina]
MDILENMTPVPLPLPDVLDRTKTTPNYPPMMWLGYRIHDRDVRQVWHNYYADSTVSRKTIDKDYDKCSEKLATVLRWAEHDSQEEWKTLWGCKKFTMIQCGLGYPNSDMWLVSVVDSWDWSGLSDKGRRAILRDVECVKKLLGQEGDPHWYLGIESTWWMQPQEIDRVKRMARRR